MKQQIAKAEGYFQLKEHFKDSVLNDYAVVVSNVKTLQRYYRSQDKLSDLFNKAMGWKAMDHINWDDWQRQQDELNPNCPWLDDDEPSQRDRDEFKTDQEEDDF